MRLEPRAHLACRRLVQRHDRAAAVVRVFAPLDEALLLERPGQRARRRERDPERLREVGDARRALGGEVGDEPRLPAPAAAVQRPVPQPEPPGHPPQEAAQLDKLLLFGYHPVTIIEWEERR